MSKLTEFLQKNSISDLKSEIELTGRLEGMKFTIKSMNSDDYDEYTKVCQKIVGKEVKIDTTKLRLMILKNHCVEPDFKNQELLNSCGCVTPEQFIQNKLLPGEQTILQEAILNLSGFNTSLKDDVEEAKN